MRYAQKMVCLLVLVLAASFGIGGCVLLYSDFAVQRSRAAVSDAAAHAQACTLLQTEIIDLQRRGVSIGDAALTARVEAQQRPAALWRGDTLVCATLPGLADFPLENAAAVTVRTEGAVYTVYASDLQGGLRLVTAYDRTELYRGRRAALTRFLALEVVVLGAAALVTALLAARLTRPLAVLTEAAAAIAHEGRRLEALSHKLLALLGLSEEALTLTAVPLDSLWPRLRAACPSAVLQTPPPPAPIVAGDADLLLDLLCNLVQNAVRAAAPGSPVALYCSQSGDAVTLTVADTGCGIPPEELPRITEPFYMVDKSRARRQGGSGLGLALCRRIAAAHGSALQIESEPGKGTRVSVTLPVWREVQS